MAEEVKLSWSPLTPLKKENIEPITQGSAGVFRFSYTNDDGKNFYVFFVGKTTDLRNELLSYLLPATGKEVCVINHISLYDCRYRFAIIPDENTRNAAERQVCKFYQPTCNSVQPQAVNENIIINVT